METTILNYVGPQTLGDGKESVNSYEHRRANTGLYTSPFGKALRYMLLGWERYATTHRERYESSIGEDGVLGPEWAAIGESLRGLLNGDCGGWDAGSLCANISRVLREHGCEPRE
jgi:hypothetical protein